MTETCFENAAICTAMIAALSLFPAVYADECEQLDSLELPHTEITISERIEAGTFAAAGANPSTRDAFARLPPSAGLRARAARRPIRISASKSGCLNRTGMESSSRSATVHGVARSLIAR